MSAASESSSARILIASADSVLSQLRKQVIEQQSSFEVLCSRNRQHAVALLKSELFDVLLLCNSLTQKTRIDFAAIYRNNNPNGKIVVFEGREPQAFPYDVMLRSPVSPAELIKAVRSLVDKKFGTGQ